MEAAKKAEREYKAKHPEAQRLRVKADVAAYKPRSKEVRDVPVKAVSMFLSDPATIHLSNASLAQKLGTHVAAKLPANILTERFSPKQKERVAELLRLRRVSLDLDVHYSPSKVKLALKANDSAEEAHQKVVVEITFTDDVVTVGDRAYPIQRGSGVRRIHVGKSKLNVDVLKALVEHSR